MMEEELGDVEVLHAELENLQDLCADYREETKKAAERERALLRENHRLERRLCERELESKNEVVMHIAAQKGKEDLEALVQDMHSQLRRLEQENDKLANELRVAAAANDQVLEEYEFAAEEAQLLRDELEDLDDYMEQLQGQLERLANGADHSSNGGGGTSSGASGGANTLSATSDPLVTSSAVSLQPPITRDRSHTSAQLSKLMTGIEDRLNAANKRKTFHEQLLDVHSQLDDSEAGDLPTPRPSLGRLLTAPGRLLLPQAKRPSRRTSAVQIHMQINEACLEGNIDSEKEKAISKLLERRSSATREVGPRTCHAQLA